MTGLPSTRRRQAFFAQLKGEVVAFKGLAEPTIEALLRADDLGLTDLLWVDRCPLLDFVRGDPRFGAARERIAARANAILSALA